MTPLEIKVSKDITTIIESTSDFLERYNLHRNTITEDLHVDLLYFHRKSNNLFNQFNRKDSLQLSKGFGFSHTGMGLHKSAIEPFPDDLRTIITHLRVLKKEIENGDLIKYSEISKRELFTDHLEYSNHLLDHNHKDAAAVIIGAVLEDKLRMICQKNNLPIRSTNNKLLTIDPMNISLAKNNIYSESVKKEIELYGNIRNNAAHGDYSQYTKKQVEEMMDYVSTFNY